MPYGVNYCQLQLFYHYGTNHQECLAHVLRYLKNSMENEPERTWNKEMRNNSSAIQLNLTATQSFSLLT